MDQRIKKLALWVAVVLAALLVGVGTLRFIESRRLAAATQAAASAPARVNVVTVSAAPSSSPLALPGETAAWHESTIYARVDGYVQKWLVDIGDHVVAGQVLAVLETPELDAELAASRAKLVAGRADVRVKQAEAEFAHSTYERWRESPQGVVSEQEREDKKAGDASAAANLEAARAQVNLDQAGVDRLTALQNFKNVTAPYEGTIIERRIDIGNLVTAGSSGDTTLLYRMVKDNPLRVFVEAPQSVLPDLMKVGVAAEVTTSEMPPRHFQGTVARTSQAVNTAMRTFRIEVDIPNPNRTLVPGMYVTVTFQLKNPGLMTVPAAAMLFTTNGPRIAVVDPDNGAVQFHPVAIARDEGSVIDLQSGASPGEQVILNVSSQIRDGDKVEIIQPTEPLAQRR